MFPKIPFHWRQVIFAAVEDYAGPVDQIRDSERGIFEFQFGNGNTDRKLTKHLLRGENGRTNP